MAVDFFFLLSGFVLGRSYEQKLTNDLSGEKFFEIRLIRLYPLFALGVALGAVCMVGKSAVHDPTALASVPAVIAFLCNALMLPASTSPTLLFPYDPPAWSLFFEIVINGAFGFLLYRLPSALVGLVCAMTGLAFLFVIHQYNYGDLGSAWNSIFVGLMRVVFSFPLGMVLARLLRKTAPQRSHIAYGVLAALVVILGLALPVRFDWLYDMLAVLILFPALVWLGSQYELPTPVLGPLLGEISYPLYAIHYPILQVTTFVLFREMHISGIILAITFLPAVCLLALLTSRYFDVPVRSWLSYKYHLRKTAMPSTTD
jgi:peptidoglycan/LPS O-acetylase OafA/YrhL